MQFTIVHSFEVNLEIQDLQTTVKVKRNPVFKLGLG